VSTRWARLSFLELKNAWNEFLLVSSTPDFFRSWEWLDCWLQVYGKGKQPLVLGFYDDERLVGLAPLVISRLIALKRILFMASGVSDRHGFIVAPGYETAFARELRPALDQLCSWHYCDLQELPEDDPVATQLASPQDVRSEPQSVLPFIPLPASWEEFLERYSKKRRDKIKYYPHLLDRCFDWRIERVREEQLEDRMAHFARLSVRRWLRKGIPSSFMEPAFRRFHLRVAQAGLDSYLRFYALMVDDRPVAYLYGFSFARRFSFYLCAQDDRFASYGPGFVLQTHAIRSSIEEGCLIFDFLKGLEAYKLHWKPKLAGSRRLVMQQGGWESKIGASLAWGEHTLVQKIKRKTKRI
jgi:CelD/BcsL family acetyltransferase involved in cellulose biosynthesis